MFESARDLKVKRNNLIVVPFFGTVYRLNNIILIFKQSKITKMQTNNSITTESKLQLLFFGLLSLSFIGYFALQENWIGFVFAHLAATSIIGFYGCLAAALAKKKGHSYKRAFLIGFFVPLILGVISAFLLPYIEGDSAITCGGWTVLASGIVIVIYYSFVKRKEGN